MEFTSPLFGWLYLPAFFPLCLLERKEEGLESLAWATWVLKISECDPSWPSSPSSWSTSPSSWSTFSFWSWPRRATCWSFQPQERNSGLAAMMGGGEQELPTCYDDDGDDRDDDPYLMMKMMINNWLTGPALVACHLKSPQVGKNCCTGVGSSQLWLHRVFFLSLLYTNREVKPRQKSLPGILDCPRRAVARTKT